MSESLIISEKEPIAAVATPIGEGGIAVIRISGRGAIAKVQERFKGKDLRTASSHTIHFGRIIDEGGRLVDEVLIILIISCLNRLLSQAFNLKISKLFLKTITFKIFEATQMNDEKN